MTLATIDDILIERVHQAPLKANTRKSEETASRNKRIFARYAGIEGSRDETLESIGQDHELTRECIRQIVNRVESKIELTPEDQQVVSKLISMIRREAPIKESHLIQMACDKGLLSKSEYRLVNVLGYCARMLNEPFPFKTESHNGSLFVFQKEDQTTPLPATILSEANRCVNRYGAYRVNDLLEDLFPDLESASEKTKARRYIRSALESGQHACQFIDAQSQLFVLDRDRPSRLERRLAQVFQMYSRVPLAVLYQAMTRSMRQAHYSDVDYGEKVDDQGNEPIKQEKHVHRREQDRQMYLTRKKFPDYLKNRGFTINAQLLVEPPSTLEFHEILPLERQVIDVLSEDEFGIMREMDIKDRLAIPNDTNEHYSFVTTTYYSPLMIRPERGQLAILGTVRRGIPSG